jgi:hypothetical protein
MFAGYAGDACVRVRVRERGAHLSSALRNIPEPSSSSTGLQYGLAPAARASATSCAGGEGRGGGAGGRYTSTNTVGKAQVAQSCLVPAGAWLAFGVGWVNAPTGKKGRGKGEGGGAEARSGPPQYLVQERQVRVELDVLAGGVNRQHLNHQRWPADEGLELVAPLVQVSVPAPHTHQRKQAERYTIQKSDGCSRGAEASRAEKAWGLGTHGRAYTNHSSL